MAARSQWSSWSGLLQCTPHSLVMPADREAMIEATRVALRAAGPLRVAGSGHSFSPIVPSEGTLLLSDRLAGVIGVDTDQQTAEIGAGTKIAALGEPLLVHGLALANQGDIDQQSMAGAIATGTHGTGPSLGSLSTMVTGIELVDGGGEIVRLDDSRSDQLAAAAVAIGLLGVVLSVTLRLVPAYRLHERQWQLPAPETMAQLDQLIAATRHFEFFWRPDTDLCDCKSLQALAADVPLPDLGPGERCDWSGRIFPSVRLRKFIESEWAVPYDRGPACFFELRAMMRARHPEVVWPIEYRTIAGDSLPLSPNFGGPRVTLSIHQGVGLPWEDFFADAQAIFRNHGGRPHWGKWHGLGARDLAALYPQWESFHRIRRAFDPHDRFLTPPLAAMFR